jgi:long-chain acyl-CoA synthetase
MQLLDRLTHHAQTRSDDLAYTDQFGHSLTWRQLHDAACDVATELRQRLPNQGTVLLCAPNQIQYPIAFLGLLAAGCDVFPVPADIAEAELTRAAQQSRAVGIVGHERARQTLKGLYAWNIDVLFPSPGTPGEGGVRVLSDTAAASPSRQNPHPTLSRRTGRGTNYLLLQSSGTTGLPKIVKRSFRSLDAVSAAMTEAVDFRPTDHVLAAVPLTHSYGLEHGLLAPVWAGSRVHLCRGLDLPSVVSELEKGEITLFPAVPAVFEMLSAVADTPAVTSLRTAYSAGAPLPQTVTDRFAERFGIRVAQLYGATEIGSVTFNSPHEEPFDPGSVGKPMRGVDIHVVDVTTAAPLQAGEEGHIAISARSMFDGYLYEDAQLLDGYFPTGDLGHVDKTGRLFITGRLKLLIDVGGMKVNPLEVEAILRQHPAVGDCVVVPVRQSETVHRLKAVIMPQPGMASPGTAELRSFAKSHLSAYKVPRLFEIRDDLPRSSTGKVLRHLVET